MSKMHLYYTGEDNGVPTVTFNKSTEMIDKTIKEFDAVVEKYKVKILVVEPKIKIFVPTVI